MSWRTLVLYMLIIALLTAAMVVISEAAVLNTIPASAIITVPLAMGIVLVVVFRPWRHEPEDTDYKDGQP